MIQDVECSGNESHPSECNVNTNITTECLNSSSIVRINCFFNSKFDSKYSMIIIIIPKEEIGLLMVDLLKNNVMVIQSIWKTESFNSFIGILYAIYSELDINFLEGRNKRELFFYIKTLLYISHFVQYMSVHTISAFNSSMCRVSLNTRRCLIGLALLLAGVAQ